MKKAFTLAEVLLVLLIIGILVGLCMDAGKVSLKNAYSLYYYRSYDALLDAYNTFLYYKKHEHTVTSTDPSTGETISETKGITNLPGTFAEYFADLAGGTVSGTTTTIEGITYNFGASVDADYSQITVTIPSVKTRLNTSGKATYTVYYSTGYLNSERTLADGTVASQYDYSGLGARMILLGDTSSYTDEANIINNSGILPTYIDDGLVGRFTKTTSGTSEYKAIIPRSYRYSFCLAADASDNSSTLSITNGRFNVNTYCSGLTMANSTLVGKPLKLIKPKHMR